MRHIEKIGDIYHPSDCYDRRYRSCDVQVQKRGKFIFRLIPAVIYRWLFIKNRLGIIFFDEDCQ